MKFTGNTPNNTLDYERKTLNISDDEKVFVRIETKTGESPLTRYQYDNHLGSACLELNNTGQIISYEEYHPFGTTSYRSGRTETEVSLKHYKYCGKERDEETGLYYYGMRYYAAWLCRFVSADPLQFKYPYYTPYQYAGNKPITFIDLDGAEPFPNPYNELKNMWDYVAGEVKAFFSFKEKPVDKKEEIKKEEITQKEVKKDEVKKDSSTIASSDTTSVQNVKFVGTKRTDISEYSLNLISNIAKEVGITANITSTRRDLGEQIDAMYYNIKNNGVKSQLKLYNSKGDKIINTYVQALKEGKSEAEIKELMKATAIEEEFISTHMSSDYDKLNAIDIGYSSFSKFEQRKEFIEKMEESEVRVLNEPENNAVHLEIKQNK